VYSLSDFGLGLKEASPTGLKPEEVSSGVSTLSLKTK
jgi:hypothetical protein